MQEYKGLDQATYHTDQGVLRHPGAAHEGKELCLHIRQPEIHGTDIIDKFTTVHSPDDHTSAAQYKI